MATSGPGVKKVSELSLRESLSLGHGTITPGHVLLGLTRDRDGVAMVEAGPQIPRAFQPRVEMLPSPNQLLKRLLTATGEHALSAGRTEFGIGDLLDVIMADDEATAVVASLGADIQSLHKPADGERPALGAAQ